MSYPSCPTEDGDNTCGPQSRSQSHRRLRPHHYSDAFCLPHLATPLQKACLPKFFLHVLSCQEANYKACWEAKNTVWETRKASELDRLCKDVEINTENLRQPITKPNGMEERQPTGWCQSHRREAVTGEAIGGGHKGFCHCSQKPDFLLLGREEPRMKRKCWAEAGPSLWKAERLCNAETTCLYRCAYVCVPLRKLELCVCIKRVGKTWRQSYLSSNDPASTLPFVSKYSHH